MKVGLIRGLLSGDEGSLEVSESELGEDEPESGLLTGLRKG